ncbi:MAG: hypothetical protein NT094_04615 [Candidatus Staskawiczbacteria bacterium]|nr:hypothetical protein [Candidatus Staskawiczbacteria bacterium]
MKKIYIDPDNTSKLIKIEIANLKLCVYDGFTEGKKTVWENVESEMCNNEKDAENKFNEKCIEYSGYIEKPEELSEKIS